MIDALEVRPEALQNARKRPESRPAPLTPAQRELAARHIGLVGVHLRTRLSARRKTAAGRQELDEFFQAGCLALVQAAARYDPGRDGNFPAYALPRIRRAVHAAILAGRSVLHVPYRIASARTGPSLPPCTADTRQLAGGSPRATAVPAPYRPQSDGETIRHALRRRFERAARQAGDRLAGQFRHRPNAAEIFRRITAERVLVSDPAARTPTRRLAGDLGLSSSQITEYEQRILAVTRDQLRDDAPTGLLIRFAGQDPAGFDGIVDARRRRKLARAEIRAFDRRFAALDPAEQARTLYLLVERSAGAVREVARNLFRLTHAQP